MKFLVNGKNLTDNLLVIEIQYESHYPRFISLLTKLTTNTQVLSLTVSPAPKKYFSSTELFSLFGLLMYILSIKLKVKRNVDKVKVLSQFQRKIQRNGFLCYGTVEREIR